MILFTILAITLLALVIAIALTAFAGGAVFIVMFGDLIVFALVIAIIVKLIRKFRKKK